MNEIKNIIDELGIAALESNIKIAGVAVVSDSGKIIQQTSNWDLTHQTQIIQNVIKGDNSFVINGTKFSIINSTEEGIIGTNENGMGHILIMPFQGGVLVSYAMPQADLSQALSFLKVYAMKMDEML